MEFKYLCDVHDVPADGACKVFNVEGKSIGLFKLAGIYHAVLDYCPHQGASLCHGTIGWTTAPSNVYEYQLMGERKILRCPWHGWEFDIQTGKSLFDPKVRTMSFQVELRENRVGILM